MAAKREERAAACEVDRKQCCAWAAGLGDARRGIEAIGAVRIRGSRQKIWIDDSQAVILVQESVLIRRACFYVVYALYVRNVVTQSRVGQVAVLRDGFRIDRTKIGQRIRARI